MSREVSLSCYSVDFRNSKSEKQNFSLGCQQQRHSFNQMCVMLEFCSPLPKKRTSLGFPLFCQVLSPKLSIRSAGHTHRSRAVCHRTQMPSCGRYSFSSIRLFLGKTLRQSKENRSGAALGLPCGEDCAGLYLAPALTLCAWTLLSLRSLPLA